MEILNKIMSHRYASKYEDDRIKLVNYWIHERTTFYRAEMGCRNFLSWDELHKLGLQ